MDSQLVPCSFLPLLELLLLSSVPHVEATGLTASTKYSYEFENCANPDNKSPVGKTGTAPGKYAKHFPTQKFAIYSCSNYPK